MFIATYKIVHKEEMSSFPACLLAAKQQDTKRVNSIVTYLLDNREISLTHTSPVLGLKTHWVSRRWPLRCREWESEIYKMDDQDHDPLLAAGSDFSSSLRTDFYFYLKLSLQQRCLEKRHKRQLTENIPYGVYYLSAIWNIKSPIGYICLIGDCLFLRTEPPKISLIPNQDKYYQLVILDSQLGIVY